MGRSRGGSGRGGGSGRSRIPGIVRGRYSGIGQHSTSRNEKAKSGISKALGNTILTYGEDKSADEMQTT